MWHVREAFWYGNIYWKDYCISMNGRWEVCERVRKRATTRDANLEWPWVTVRSFLSFLTQPFASFSSPYFPLHLSLPHLALPFSICPTSFASLQLPRVSLVVILLSVIRKGRGTHGNLGFSVTILSLANGKHAKTRRCVYLCIRGCVWVLSTLATLGWAILQSTRFFWPYAEAQGHTSSFLIKMQR